MKGPLEEPEHHVPAHRPSNFPAAVARLEQLHAELKNGSSRPVDEITALAEWLDIVRWLPELAADSDLAELPWNRVNDVAKRLDAATTSIAARPAAEHSAAISGSEREFVEGLKALREVVDTEPEAFRISGYAPISTEPRPEPSPGGTTPMESSSTEQGE